MGWGMGDSPEGREQHTGGGWKIEIGKWKLKEGELAVTGSFQVGQTAKARLGLPCAVTPEGTWPPFSIQSKEEFKGCTGERLFRCGQGDGEHRDPGIRPNEAFLQVSKSEQRASWRDSRICHQMIRQSLGWLGYCLLATQVFAASQSWRLRLMTNLLHPLQKIERRYFSP